MCHDRRVHGASTSSGLRVAVHTETRGPVGGSTAFLVDLLPRLQEHGVDAFLIGNPDPVLDLHLAQHAPELLPRVVLPTAMPEDAWPLRLARAVRDRLAALRGRGREAAGGPDAVAPSAEGWAGPEAHEGFAHTLLRAVIRYPQMALNVVRLRHWLREARPDVLHVNNGGYPAASSCRAAVIAAGLARVPVVLWVHNSPYAPAWPRTLEGLVDRAVRRSAATWVTGGRLAAAELEARYGVDPRHLEVVPLGVEPPAEDAPERMPHPEGPVVLAVLALLEARKGHHVLLDALARLVREGADVELLVLGDGERRTALEAQAARLGLTERVRFLGWVDDVDGALALADVLVHPATGFELLPYAIKEGMRAGLPVVASDVGGISELVVDGTTGFLVVPEDPAALAAALDVLIADPARAARLGEAGRERIVDVFGVEAMTASMLGIYREAAGVVRGAPAGAPGREKASR